MKAIFLSAVSILFIHHLTFAQTTLTGAIKDGEGMPLAGATIEVKGEKVYSTADENGDFSITTAKGLPGTLVIRLVGFDPQELLISESSALPVEIVLKEDSQLP